MGKVSFVKFVLILLFISTNLNAETVKLLSNNVIIKDSPNGNSIATLLNKPNIYYPEYRSNKNISGELWIEVVIDAWIWRKSTNIKNGNEKNLQLDVEKENLRIFPGKSKIAVVNKYASLRIHKIEKNWVSASLSGWVLASATKFKLKSLASTVNNNTAKSNSLYNDLKKELDIINKEKEKAIIEIKGLKLKINKIEKNSDTLRNEISNLNINKKSNLNEIAKLKSLKYNSNNGDEKYNILLYYIPILSLLLIVIIILVVLIKKVTKEKDEFLTVNKLINENIGISNRTNEIIIQKFEENKGIMKYELEKRINEFQENMMRNITEIQSVIVKNLSSFNEKTTNIITSMELNVVKSLSSSTASQDKSFSEFNEKTLKTLSTMNSVIVTSLSDSSTTQDKSFLDFNEKVVTALSDMKSTITTTLNSSTEMQYNSLFEFRDKTTESIENALKRTTDSLDKRFDELRKTTDKHMDEINNKVENRLKDGFEQTNKVFSDIKDRLLLIDQAQQKISDLSNNVISLQETLDNKGARGAFGEVQLAEIVKDMIPEKYCKFQEAISNGKRPDCLIILPQPTGNLAIDAKFPLENYKIMFDRDALKQDKEQAKTNFKRDIKKHIKDISEKYIISGETANGAVMFIPSEAVFAEIHAHHPDLVKEAQNKQVWMASPATLMAILTTARAVLADNERSKQAKIIHDHLTSLSGEFGRFKTRMDNLAKHIRQANEDVNDINITARKITNKFIKIESSDLDGIESVGNELSIDHTKT